MTSHADRSARSGRHPAIEVFLAFLRLGCTSFGGPVAHLAYFRTEFVERRAWLKDAAYADLVAFCQFLPGPASSQVGIALGLFRAGLPGAFAAWAGFTAPSALILVLFGLLVTRIGGASGGPWLHGLAVVTVAVIAQALWGMGRSLCPDRLRASLAVAAMVVASTLPGVIAQTGMIVAGGMIGWRWLQPSAALPHVPLPMAVSQRSAVLLLSLFAGLLILLPILADHDGAYLWKLFNSFYRAGALVFGGGHVVLSLLQVEVVPPGWVSNDAFLAGYGATQAMPGPVSTFAAYLGAISTQQPNGWTGAAIALAAIFLPSFLLVLGGLPLWEMARRQPAMQRAMLGVNASVVGLLLATFYQPVWTSGILSARDFALAVLAFLLLVFWKLPPWLIVVFCALAAGLGWH